MNYDVTYLADILGYDDVMDMLNDAVCDSIVPAICTNCGADYELEPDARNCYCDNCGQNKVSSCIELGLFSF